jgi:hypothetical protein
MYVVKSGDRGKTFPAGKSGHTHTHTHTRPIGQKKPPSPSPPPKKREKKEGIWREEFQQSLVIDTQGFGGGGGGYSGWTGKQAGGWKWKWGVN